MMRPAGLIERPVESESVFSRGKESSTLTSGEDTPTLSASSRDDDEYEEEAYEGHLLQYQIHPHANRGSEGSNHMIPMQHEQHEASPKPPRHPGHFSFSDVGRRKRLEQPTAITTARTNPFEASNNPFDTSAEESNSIVGDASAEDSNVIYDDPPIQRMVSPATTNPFDESSSADFVETPYPPPPTGAEGGAVTPSPTPGTF
eukprot:scaffold44515_cov191-Amphora_coffeaeformis.AAC.3